MGKNIICTVTNDLSYDQRMIRICTSLAHAGYKVLLIGRLKRNSESLINKPFQQKRLKCWFEKGKFFYIEYNIRLLFYLLFVKFDAICAVDLDTILPGLFLSKIRGKPCVYDAHEYFTETPEVVRRPIIKYIWEMIAKFAIPRVEVAYTVGEELAKIFEQRYKKKFWVIRNVPFRQEGIANPTRNIILYQGVLNEGRGLEQAIEAMQTLENSELWLAGEGDLSAFLRQKVIHLQLENKVKFLGYLHPKELHETTLQAKIGLNLLENRGLSYYYSLANKTFDYIQAGIPSIHMNFPEYNKINEKHDVFLLIEDLNIQRIITAIENLIKNKDLYNELRENCLEAKKIFVWEKEEEKLIALYNNLLKNKH
ncbi:MAG: glycosyltransferase [Saprospiraceae bacterium]|nr:glycosyltransferase [Saprospiraceae bacterium]